MSDEVQLTHRGEEKTMTTMAMAMAMTTHL
jgi:hypothetical protein